MSYNIRINHQTTYWVGACADPRARSSRASIIKTSMGLLLVDDTGPGVACMVLSLLATGTWLVWRRGFISRRRRPSTSKQRIRKKSNSQFSSLRGYNQPNGLPTTFKRPDPKAYPEWSITDTKPLPYRPFRYGPKYNITMGLRPMQWDDWIELDNEYMKYHADKARRIDERGSKCCRTADDPRVQDGVVELLEEFCDYLPKRYPSIFEKTDFGMMNKITEEEFDVRQNALTRNGVKEDPMQLAARMIQDDLAIMFEGDDGQYYLLAGAILLAGFWRLEDKFGMPLSEIHTSGDVPGFKEKLEKGMTNFFRRIKPEAPVLRNNYFIQVDDQLPWSPSIGSEDAEYVSWDTAEKDRPIQHHYFRSERQSLRRLPRSGGVVFTIRTYFLPMTEICKEPYVPGRLASAIRSWGDDVSKYKGKAKYGDVLLEYLDAEHAKQVRGGLDLSTEDGLRSYPY